MADITGFNNISTELDVSGGITISGRYTGGGNTDDTDFGSGITSTNNEDIRVEVLLDDGTWYDLGNPGSWGFGSQSYQKTFSLNVTNATTLSVFTNGTAINDSGQATFRFLDKDSTPAVVPVNGNQSFSGAVTTPGISSFTVNTTTSELNPAGGITLEGTFTGGGSNANKTDNEGDIVVQIKEVGSNTWTTLTGNFTWDFAHKTYKFVSSGGSLPSSFVMNDKVEFKFYDKNGNGPSDDVTLTTTPVITLCFYPGTMIATPEGEKAVETLAIGDLVLRQDGSTASVRWMGRNTISLLFADKMKSLPVRIKKDALGANVPSRDLLVSPDHAIFVDGILAHAGALVNGTSIVRETNVPSKFVYHHIELAEHALIVADNTPAESFIDNVDRANYDNWAEHEALFGDLPAIQEMDLPRAKSQRQVPSATRQRLAARAVELGYSVVDAAVA